MLTFVKDSSAVELVGIHRNSNRSRKPEAPVYFTHDQSEERQNQTPASRVLELDRKQISGAKIARMIDEVKHTCRTRSMKRICNRKIPLVSKHTQMVQTLI